MVINPRITAMTERSTSDIHRPGFGEGEERGMDEEEKLYFFFGGGGGGTAGDKSSPPPCDACDPT